MTNFLNTKIRDVEDAAFQSLIVELCHCVEWDAGQFDDSTLSFLLMAINRENPKALTSQRLMGKGILTMKVDKIVPGSVVHGVCEELTRLKRTGVEMFCGKTVLSLVKSCYPKAKPVAPRRPTRNMLRHRQMTNVILQGRKNGDL